MTKLRGREFAGGQHQLCIVSTVDEHRNEGRAVEVYPNIQTYVAKSERNGKNGDVGQEVLSSGIPGLDELLPIFPLAKRRDAGFQRGEAILVVGSPGAGKTLLGLHFLKAGLDKGEQLLWVSFESDRDGWKLATRSFDDDVFEKLIKYLTKPVEDPEAAFKFYPPARVEPDRLVNDILKRCEGGRHLDRVVLDSVTDLEQAFTDIDFKVFMTSLVQILREKHVTTMFLFRTKDFFGKMEDIGRVLASVVNDDRLP